jgi:hypothetical protein
LALWKIETPGYSVECESPAVLAVEDQKLAELLKALRDWKSAVPGTSLVRFVRDDQDTTRYNYRIEEGTTRQWRQAIYFRDGDAWMTFDVTDQWRLGEFAHQRALRDLLVSLVRPPYSCTRIVARWL